MSGPGPGWETVLDDGPQTMSMPALRPDGPFAGLTVGVVIDIPDPWRAQLRRSRASFGDPDAATIPPHITLLPPTPVDPDDRPGLVAHLEKVSTRFAPFEVRLEGTGTFRPVSPVVFVRLESGASGCDRLQQAIRSGPVHRPLQFPYHPHVTVAHNLDEPALDLAQGTLGEFSARFEVGEFWLYEHGRDGLWRPKDRFALTGP